MRGTRRFGLLAVALLFALPARAAVEIATFDTPGSVNDIVIDGTLGYVADAAGGIRVLDLSNPAAPVEIGSLAPVMNGASVRSLALVGDRLYAAENLGGLSIVDVSNPASPVRLGNITGLSIIQDVAVIGSHAFVISDIEPGFYVIDVTDPALPVQVGSLGSPGSTITVLSPTRIVAGSRLLDVSDPPNPLILEENLTFNGALGPGFAITNGLTRYGLGDPNHVAFVNQWLAPTTEGSYTGIDLMSDLAWAVGGSSPLALFDVTDAGPSHPELATLDFGPVTNVARLRLDGTRLYVAVTGSTGRGLYVFDVSDPAAPVELGSVAADPADIDVVGNTVYLVDRFNTIEGTAGLYVFDVTNPASIAQLAYVPIEYPGLVRAAGSRVYVADVDGTVDEILVYDVSNPAAPAPLGSLPGLTTVDAIATSGNLLLVTLAGLTNGSLSIYDASVPSAITQLGSYTTTGQPGGLVVAGNRAYVTSGLAEVIDFSLPFAPTRIASFDQPSSSFGDPALAGSRLHVAATGDHVFTLDLADLAAPRVVGASVRGLRNGVLATADMVASSTALFYADFTKLHVFDVSAPSGLGPRRLATFPGIDGTRLVTDASRDLVYVLDGVLRVVDVAADRVLYECANGLDDDGDTLIDHAADSGCRDGHDPSEEADCSDGVDDDGDGAIDFPADASCASASEASEAPNCDDGADSDGDGLADFGADPGCGSRLSELESPKCQNGLDDDGDGKIDFDGGASLNGGVPIATADPNCGAASRNAEASTGCGLGGELLLALVAWRRFRRWDQTLRST